MEDNYFPKEILLIEDNPSDVELAKRAFAKAGIINKIVALEDGQEALEYLFRDNQNTENRRMDFPAIILLDLKLPIIDGLEVLKQVKSNPLTRRIPVVVLTSSVEMQDKAKAYDLGVNSYIRKPVDFTQFAEAVRQLGIYWLTINEPPPQL
jgi:CheY-like chemotaxis protein